jgi:hypothetical protein
MKAKEVPKVIFQLFSQFCICMEEERTTYSQSMVFVTKELDSAQTKFSGEIGLYEDESYSCFVVWERNGKAGPVIKIDYKVNENEPVKVQLDMPLENLNLMKFICKIIDRAADLATEARETHQEVKHASYIRPHPSL